MIKKLAGLPILVLCVLSMLVADCDAATTPPGLTTYRNERWGFCIAYPTAFSPYEGVDKAGISLMIPSDPPSSNAISIGALPNMESPTEPGKRMTLKEIADADFASIGDGEVPSRTNVRVAARMETTFSGIRALRTRVTFVQGGIAQMIDTLYVIRGSTIYEFTLKCKIGDRAEYEATFRSILKSFKWECNR